MTNRFSVLAAAQCGVFLRPQVIAAGLSSDEIRQRIRTNAWTAIRRGAYVESAIWRSMTEAERYRARCFAVFAKIGGDAVLSHVSAVALHDLPTWGHDLGMVHASRGRTSRVEAGVVHHRSPAPAEQTAEVAGLTISAPGRALVETALISPYEACVPTADAALRAGMTTKHELLHIVDSMRDWAGARNAGRVVAFADGRAESVGESRARVALDLAGLPEPALQYDVRDRLGNLVARLDFYFEEDRTIVEGPRSVRATPSEE